MKKILKLLLSLKKSKSNLKLINKIEEVIDLEFDNTNSYYYIPPSKLYLNEV